MVQEALFKVLPLLLLMALGYLLGQRNFLSDSTRQDLKKLIVNLTLPAALFLAFAGVQLEVRLLIIPVIIFCACLLVMITARGIGPALVKENSLYFPFLMVGFEAGMLGYAIFTAVYGQENIFRFAVIDLGQVIFVFFVLVPALARQSQERQLFSETLLSFLKTPVILAIVGGILFNQSGLYDWLSGNPLYGSLQAALGLLGGMTTPLVALVIGADIRPMPGKLAAPALTIMLRLLIWIPAALLFNWLIISKLLGLDPIFLAAVMVMAVLPPPFVIPVFMRGANHNETIYVVNSLSLATLITLAAFVFIVIAYPP
jgi:predicted permease